MPASDTATPSPDEIKAWIASGRTLLHNLVADGSCWADMYLEAHSERECEKLTKGLRPLFRCLADVDVALKRAIKRAPA